MFGRKTNKDRIRELDEKHATLARQAEGLRKDLWKVITVNKSLASDVIKLTLARKTLIGCPFCCAEPTIDYTTKIRTQTQFFGAYLRDEEVCELKYQIKCENEDCKVQPKSPLFNTLDETINSWNGRCGDSGRS